MNNETFNKEHAASIDYVNQAVIDSWEKMKIWLTTNVDQLDYVARIIRRLREAYRGGEFTSAMAYADAVHAAVVDMTVALRNAGAIITDDTTIAKFGELIASVASTGFEVCILGKSGKHWRTGEWDEYIAQHGTTPEPAIPAVITPYQSFVISMPEVTGEQYKNLQWGNTTDTVQGLYANQTGSFVNVLQNSLNFYSLENTARMLLWYNPEVLPTIDYDPSDPDKNYGNYMCVRFATNEEMQQSDQHLMYDQQVYVVKQDTDGTANVAYYWEGSKYVKRFVVPRVANNITGSPAAEYAWGYHPWEGDTRQFALPTINHLLMMYVYYNDINQCLTTLNRSPLPASNSWSCQQYNAYNAPCVTIPSGNVGSYTKNYTYAVVPVAAL